MRDIRFTLPRFRFYVYIIRPKTCALSYIMSDSTLDIENDVAQTVNLYVNDLLTQAVNPARLRRQLRQLSNLLYADRRAFTIGNSTSANINFIRAKK